MGAHHLLAFQRHTAAWIVACSLASGGWLHAAAPARAAPGVVTVAARPFTEEYDAYAQVEPVAVLPIRAGAVGVVTGLDIVPGESIRSGRKLAGLGGPEFNAALVRAQAAVAAAAAQFEAATKALDLARRQRETHLGTKQQIFEAESALAAATGARDGARSDLEAAQRMATLVAPVDGTVLSVDAANGQRVAPGDAVCTLQPAHQLWARAVFYGRDVPRLRVGMAGRFVPAGGGEPVPVEVAAVFAALAPDGGTGVGLRAAAPSPSWRNGEYGRVTLAGPTRPVVMVPTRALVLDQGRWWVLVQTPQGLHPQPVVPGAARGWDTVIERGLEPGAAVLVENAYREFHRAISASYQPPD